MLCPEVWSFDPPRFNSQESRGFWKGALGRRNMNHRIKQNNHLLEYITVLLPNCKTLPATVCGQNLDQWDSYVVQNLSLAELIEPRFIELFIKRGQIFGISQKDSSDNLDCIASLTPEGRLYIALDKETCQSVQLVGKPISGKRSAANCDKYLCEIDLRDTALLTATNYRATIKHALTSLPRLNMQLVWQPPQNNICPSSIAGYWTTLNYAVTPAKCASLLREELTMKVPTFDDLTESAEMLEYLGMLTMDCAQTADEYLSSYQYEGDTIRVKNVQVVKLKGFFTPDMVIKLLDDIISIISPEMPWISLHCAGFMRTPFCDKAQEDFHDIAGVSAYTLVLNKENFYHHQIVPIKSS